MLRRRRLAMLVAEFLGVTILSTITLSMIGRTSFPFFLAVAVGTAFGAMAYLFGAHSNPAVTLGLWTMRKVQTTQAVVLVIAQMLGGLAAWQLNEYLLNNQIENMAGASFDWRILTAEAVGAFVLGLGVAVAVTRVYEGAKLAVVMGVSLSMGVLVATIAANGLLNPAVALGVQSWSWTYSVAPLLGTIVGMNFYQLVFVDRTKKAVKATASRSRSTSKKTTARKTTTKRKAAKR